MGRTIELISIKEIEEKSKLKRISIYKTYRDMFVQIPTTGNKAFFDKSSVIDAFVKVRNVDRSEIEKMFA